VAEAAELGADGRGARVAEFFEDGQRLLPHAVRRLGVSHGVMGVAEMAQCVGFVVAVAEGAEQVEGVFVGFDGRPVLAEVMVGVAQADPVGLRKLDSATLPASTR